MKKTVLRIVALMLVAVIACAALVSCGKTLSGTYKMDLVGVPEFTFDGNKVSLGAAGVVAVEGTYEIKGDKITFTWDGEDALAVSFAGELPFEEGDGFITISGVKFVKAD